MHPPSLKSNPVPELVENDRRGMPVDSSETGYERVLLSLLLLFFCDIPQACFSQVKDYGLFYESVILLYCCHAQALLPPFVHALLKSFLPFCTKIFCSFWGIFLPFNVLYHFCLVSTLFNLFSYFLMLINSNLGSALSDFGIDCCETCIVHYGSSFWAFHYRGHLDNDLFAAQEAQLLCLCLLNVLAHQEVQ